MISLNDVLLAMSNIPVDDPIAEIWGRGLQDGYEIIEYTGALPITITADGNALLDYQIYGNTVQNGTPTPENPVDVVGCGVRTENLFDKSTITTNAFDTLNGTQANSNYYCSDFIPITTTTYYFQNVCGSSVQSSVVIYDMNKQSLRYASVTGSFKASGALTFIEGDAYIRINCYRTADVDTVMLNLGSTATPYEPYGYKLPMVSRTENLFDINEITECSVGTISRNGIEYTDIGYYTISAFGALNGWCYVRVLNGNNIVSTAYLIVPKQLTPIKINLSVGQRLVIYDANPGAIEGSTSLFEQWKPVILYSNSSQPEYPSSYIPYGSTATNIYLGEVETTRRIKKLVLTGSEEIWHKSATRNYSWYIFPATIGTIEYTPFYCSHGETVTSVSDYTYGKVFCDNTCNLGIFDSSIDSVAKLNAYLAAQYAAGTPVTIWYVLKNPETGIVNEPLMKIGDYADTLSMEQADASIPTFADTTVIDYDGATKPSQMYIKYRR